ncbi:MAG: 23S rRNA pseudouridine1911/1915/1917 synthase [Cyclobacteriaceae bacterium]
MKNPYSAYEDNHLLIVHKPAGWLVQGDHTGDSTITDWGKSYIKENYNKPGDVFLHPVHRIDRPVSGLVIFARTSKALERMTAMFRDDEVEKTYVAIIKGKLRHLEGKMTHWLAKDAKKNITTAYHKEEPGSKKAHLTYEVLHRDEIHSLLKVMPKTGRPHQIRAQLADEGCPIQGDLKYGYQEPNKDRSISLHAYRLSFIHPVKKEPIKVTSAPHSQVWEEYLGVIDELA